MFSHANLSVSIEDIFDDGTCQALFETVKMCIAVVYRLPDATATGGGGGGATATSFSDAVQFLANKIQAINDDSYHLPVLPHWRLQYVAL